MRRESGFHCEWRVPNHGKRTAQSFLALILKAWRHLDNQPSRVEIISLSF